MFSACNTCSLYLTGCCSCKCIWWNDFEVADWGCGTHFSLGCHVMLLNITTRSTKFPKGVCFQHTMPPCSMFSSIYATSLDIRLYGVCSRQWPHDPFIQVEAPAAAEALPEANRWDVQRGKERHVNIVLHMCEYGSSQQQCVREICAWGLFLLSKQQCVERWAVVPVKFSIALDSGSCSCHVVDVKALSLENCLPTYVRHIGKLPCELGKMPGTTTSCTTTAYN